MSTAKEAARRWQRLAVPAALSRSDFAAAQELQADGVSATSVATLYPPDFVALVGHLTNVIDDRGLAYPYRSVADWLALERRVRLLPAAPASRFFFEGAHRLVASRLLETLQLETEISGAEEDAVEAMLYCLCAVFWLLAGNLGACTAEQAELFCEVTDAMLPDDNWEPA